MEAVIQVVGLGKRYGDVVAVHDVSFEVGRGEIFGLLGPNGAGKTTTIRMLTGLTKPTSGTAIVAGRDCVRESLAVKATIGVVSEVSNLYNEMSAWENLTFIGELYGVEKSTRTARTKELLEAFQLFERRRDRLSTYSKGMKRRVRIAAALIHNPEVLFLDEPTSGLDVQSSRLIRSIVRELNKKGTTVFLTTHYIEEADQLCNRVAIIREGRIAIEGFPEKLKASLQGERILEVAFSKDAPAIGALLETNGSVVDASREGDKYRIRTRNTSRVVTELVELASSNDLEIVSINTKQPSLEDVFVKYTGLDAVQLERMELLRMAKAGTGGGA
jgi:ABC-2 type transport system ATP-binding protein